MNLLRSALVFALFAVPAVAVGACYGATEVMLVVTTDVRCDTAHTTAVYKGVAAKAGGIGYDEAPSAETTRCTPIRDGEAEIGSLVFVPSGARSGDAAVKVVMAIEGARPEDCLADPRGTSCIVATRSFSYVEHASLRVPIALLSACRGVSCADGETCVEGGRCVNHAVNCQGEECDVVGEPAGDTDAGGGESDGAVDGDAAVPPLCGGNDGKVLAAAVQNPRHVLAVNKTHVIYALGDRVVALGKDGSEAATPFSGTLSLAARGTSWAAGAGIPSVDASQGTLFASFDGKSSRTQLGAPVSSVAVSPNRASVYALIGGKISEFSAADLKEGSSMPGSVAVAVDAARLYTFQSNTLVAWRVQGGTATTFEKLVGDIDATARYFLSTSYEGTVFAHFRHKEDGYGIAPLRSPDTGTQVIPLSSEATALAADAELLYWTADHGNEIRIQRYSPSGGDMRAVKVAGVLPALAVDDTCVYYWVEESGPNLAARYALWAKPKTALQKLAQH